tara:strand:- start:139 stop:669 length:531 start_codon:yes stop_codon:yes gene_type:complete
MSLDQADRPDRIEFEALRLSGRLQYDADFDNLIRWISDRQACGDDYPLEWRVLVAEDDVANRLVLGSLLEKSGLQVITVENGRQALEALEREAVDLVLLDINMPEMNGLDTARAIRDLPGDRADLPVIAITSDVSPMRVNEMREAGFDICLEKPVRRDALFQIIVNSLSGRVAKVA